MSQRYATVVFHMPSAQIAQALTALLVDHAGCLTVHRATGTHKFRGERRQRFLLGEAVGCAPGCSLILKMPS